MGGPQADLFTMSDRPRARREDPETSHEAAEAAGSELGRSQLAILRLVAHGEPLTDRELNTRRERAGLPLSPSGTRTRRSELVDAGLVEWTGDHATIRGRRHRTWRLTDRGRAFVERMRGRR